MMILMNFDDFFIRDSYYIRVEYRESITTIVSVFSQRTKKESKKESKISPSQSDDSLKIMTLLTDLCISVVFEEQLSFMN